MSCLAHELRLQIHLADAVDLARDVVAVARLLQADVAHLGAAFHHRGRAFHLEVLDDDDAVAIREHVAVGVTNARLILRGDNRITAPLVTAFRTDPQRAVLVGVFGAALRADRRVGHVILGRWQKRGQR